VVRSLVVAAIAVLFPPRVAIAVVLATAGVLLVAAGVLRETDRGAQGDDVADETGDQP
jgi:hypothetical protein